MADILNSLLLSPYIPKTEVFLEQPKLSLLLHNPYSETTASLPTDKDNTIVKNISNIFNNMPTSAPLYTYGLEEAKRYSDPALNFYYGKYLGKTVEEQYAQNQSSEEQLVNGLAKFGINAGAAFVQNFVSIPEQLNLRDSKTLDLALGSGGTYGWIGKVQEEMEYKFPNYYTEWEKQNPYWSAITPSGMANFWGDKVLKNAGFTIGSIASALLIDAGIELATFGSGSGLVALKLARDLKNITGSINRGFRNLSKAAVANKMDDVYRGVSYTNDLTGTLKTAGNLSDIGSASRFALTTYLSAQGEAFTEGFHTAQEIRNTELQKRVAEKTIDTEFYSALNDKMQKGAKMTTLLNIPIIMASNLIMFPTILGAKTISSPVSKYIGKEITESGIKATNKYTAKKGYANLFKEFGIDFFTEGTQELLQGFTGNTIHDYYTSKINNSSIESLSDFMIDQIPKQLQNEQLWEEFFIGGLTGMLMTSPSSFNKSILPKSTEIEVDNLNKIYDNYQSNFKTLNSHYNTLLAQNNVKKNRENLKAQINNLESKVTLSKEEENQLKSLKKEYTKRGRIAVNTLLDLSHRSLFNSVSNMVRRGMFEYHMDILQDLQAMKIDAFNESFDTNFTTIEEKNNFVTNLINDSNKINENITTVNKIYKTNPFDNNKILNRLTKAWTQKDDYDKEKLKTQYFEDYKELLAYKLSRQQILDKRLADSQNYFKGLGLSLANGIEYIEGIVDNEQMLAMYIEAKKVQLQSLQNQIVYFDELRSRNTELSIEKINVEGKTIKPSRKYDPTKIDDERFTYESDEERFSPDKEVNILTPLIEMAKEEKVARTRLEELTTYLNDIKNLKGEELQKKIIEEELTVDQQNVLSFQEILEEAAAYVNDQQESNTLVNETDENISNIIPVIDGAQIPSDEPKKQEQSINLNKPIYTGEENVNSEIFEEGKVYIHEEDSSSITDVKTDVKGTALVSTDAEADIERIKQENSELGESILQKLGYKNKNRQPNGNVKGGQSGWKIRFNIKSPTGGNYFNTGQKTLENDKHYNKQAQKLVNWLNNYFGTKSKGSVSATIKGYTLYGFTDEHPFSIWKFLSGGKPGEADFTIYIGSADDILKFVEDVKTSPIADLLVSGNQGSDINITSDGIFKARIEGESIGFSGYHAPTNLNKVIGKKNFTFIFNGKRVNIRYEGNSLLDIVIKVEDVTLGYNVAFDKDLKKDFPELYKNIRNIIGFQLYGTYLQGSNDEFLKLTGVDKINAKYDTELGVLEGSVFTDAEADTERQSVLPTLFIKKDGKYFIIEKDGTLIEVEDENDLIGNFLEVSNTPYLSTKEKEIQDIKQFLGNNFTEENKKILQLLINENKIKIIC